MPSADIYEEQEEATTPEVTREQPLRGPDGKFVKPPEAKDTSKPETPAAEPAPKHPDWLIQQARDFGFNDAEIAEASTGELTREVKREYARLQQQQQSRQEPKTEPKPAAKVEEDDLDWGTDKDGRKLTADELVAPEIAAVLRRIHKQASEKTKKLEEELGQYRQLHQKREALRTTAICDKAFASLGDAGDAHFGKGSIAELAGDPSKTEQLHRRQAVFIAATQLFKLDTTNDTPGQIQAKLKQTAKLMLAPQAAAPPPPAPLVPEPKKNGKPRITEEDWADAGVAPANRLKEEEPDGVRKATKNLYAKIGGEPPALDDDDDEFLP